MVWSYLKRWQSSNVQKMDHLPLLQYPFLQQFHRQFLNATLIYLKYVYAMYAWNAALYIHIRARLYMQDDGAGAGGGGEQLRGRRGGMS